MTKLHNQDLGHKMPCMILSCFFVFNPLTHNVPCAAYLFFLLVQTSLLVNGEVLPLGMLTHLDMSWCGVLVFAPVVNGEALQRGLKEHCFTRKFFRWLMFIKYAGSHTVNWSFGQSQLTVPNQVVYKYFINYKILVHSYV